jgi:hypothetical protein
VTEERELTDEHVRLWCEGCAELQAMTKREYAEGKSARYYRFQAIDKALTWPLVSPASESLFSHHLDGPPDAWTSPEYQTFRDWPSAQQWRLALIEATGITPRNFATYPMPS